MVMAIHFSFAFPKASKCCVTCLCSCLVSQVCKFKKGLYLRGLQFKSGDLQKAKPTANFCASPCGSAHLQQLWQGLGNNHSLCNSSVKSEAAENIPGSGPREGLLPGSWCCSLRCNLSSLYLGSKNSLRQ